jgi:hypothetical protein
MQTYQVAFANTQQRLPQLTFANVRGLLNAVMFANMNRRPNGH